MGMPFIFEVLGLISCNSDVVYPHFILVWLLNKQFIAYVNHIQIAAPHVWWLSGHYLSKEGVFYSSVSLTMNENITALMRVLCKLY